MTTKTIAWIDLYPDRMVAFHSDVVQEYKTAIDIHCYTSAADAHSALQRRMMDVVIINPFLLDPGWMASSELQEGYPKDINAVGFNLAGIVRRMSQQTPIIIGSWDRDINLRAQNYAKQNPDPLLEIVLFRDHLPMDFTNDVIGKYISLPQ